MKQTVVIHPMVVLFFYSIVPFIYLAAVFGGYLFFMQREAEIAVGTTVVSVVAVVMELRRGKKETAWINHLGILLLLPMSLINWACYVWLSQWKSMVFCMAVCSGCALVYFVRYIQKRGIKIVMLIVCGLFAAVVAFFSFLDYCFQDFGCKRILQTLYSWDGKYRAELIYNDHGILGGDSFVNIWEVGAEGKFLVFQIVKRPKQMYLGGGDICEKVKMQWTEENNFIINGVLYRIGGEEEE
ncbi:MAG: hypothetical protein OSJ62_09805 [Lachnospiraceae bacterium]|nr:hypothetical protein [Lachnospiraceae bacterium]